MPKKPKLSKALQNDPNIIKNPTTKNQKLWNEAYIRLVNRVKSWEKKYRAKFTDIPQKPRSRIEKKDIERLNKLTWRNITEKEKQIAKKEWQYRYDEGEVQPEQNDEPVDSDEEIEIAIEEMIDEIVGVEPDGYPAYNASQIEMELRELLESSRQRMGDKQFKKFIEEHFGELQAEAANAKSGSPGRTSGQRYAHYVGRSSDQESSIANFATILNLGVPLSQEQSYTLQTEGCVQFDYGEML